MKWAIKYQTLYSKIYSIDINYLFVLCIYDNGEDDIVKYEIFSNVKKIRANRIYVYLNFFLNY